MKIDKLAKEIYGEFGFSTCTEEQQKTMVQDLFVMCFQARDIDDGKGERLVSYKMFISLFEKT